MTPAPGTLGKSLTGHLRRHSSVGWVGLGEDSGGTVSGAADLSSVQAGVMQAQQQRHETLQHQLPQGASKPHPEPAPTPPHQGPEEPDCRGADWVPSLRGRMQSGGARRERLSGGKLPGGAMWGQERDLVGEPRERGVSWWGGAWSGEAVLTSSSSGGRRGPSSVLRSRTGAGGRSRSLLSAPSAAPTSRASCSPSAPRRAGSSALTCRTCGGRNLGPPLAPRSRPARPSSSPSVGSTRGGRGQASLASAPWARGRPARHGVAPESPPPAGAAPWASSATAKRGPSGQDSHGPDAGGAAYGPSPRSPLITHTGKGLTPVKKAIAVRRCVSSALRSLGSKSANRPRRWWSAWATMALGWGKMAALPLLTNSPLEKPAPGRPHAWPLPPPPAPHLASSRTPSRWVWAPTSLLQPPACSMHVTTMRLPSPVSKAFSASTVQLGVGAVGQRAVRTGR